MGTDRELLPVGEVGDREFLVDVQRREFRGFRDPEYWIDMHSEKGREMVREIVGTEWRVYGVRGTLVEEHQRNDNQLLNSFFYYYCG